MSLTAIIKDAAVTAFNAIGDLVVSGVFTVMDEAGYDTSTGIVSGDSTDYDVEIYPDRYSEKRINGVSILATDLKVLFPSKPYNFIPSTNDRLIIYNGIYAGTYLVEAIDPETNEALWVLQMRAP